MMKRGTLSRNTINPQDHSTRPASNPKTVKAPTAAPLTPPTLFIAELAAAAEDPAAAAASVDEVVPEEAVPVVVVLVVLAARDIAVAWKASNDFAAVGFTANTIPFSQ